MKTAAFWICALLLVAFSAPSALAGDESNSANVNFTVLRDFNGKPVRNASVILHPVDNSGKQRKGGAELKTDAEGKTVYPGLPFGKIRVQVIAPGFQTFGQDYDVKEKTMEIVIKMKRPTEQYSIYK